MHIPLDLLPSNLHKRATAEGVVGIVVALCILVGVIVFAFISKATIRRLLSNKVLNVNQRRGQGAGRLTVTYQPRETTQLDELHRMSTPPPKYEPPPPAYVRESDRMAD